MNIAQVSTYHLNQKMRTASQLVGRSVALGLSFLLLIMVATPGVVAAAISQGYQSDEDLTPGTLVSAQQSGSQDNKAVLTDSSNADSLLGVVVGSKDATLAVTGPTDKLQVATSGAAEVIVSNLAGDVKDGDPVGASPIRGVGMKAVEAGKIAGVAQGDAVYGDKTVDVQSKTGTVKAKIGTVKVVMQIAYYVPPPDNSPVPKFLQVFANSVAGKQVSLVRLLASALIILAATIAIAILLYSAVRSTMVSIGRNPLAQASIYRGLWQVVIACLVIFFAALGSAYLVLTR
jgi:hypothetical protein